LPLARRLVAQYGLRSVYLSTPSQSVVDSARALASQLNVAHAPVTPTAARLAAHGLVRIEQGLVRGIVDAGREFQSYMVDMHLLSEGSAFLGSFSSNAARLAYSLMSSGGAGCLRPFLSTDINWCHAFFRGGPAVIRRDGEPAWLDIGC